MKFIKFLAIWISQQLAIPFWMVGHFHLAMTENYYDDVKILFASLGMNAVVASGFWLDWREHSAPKTDHTMHLTKQIAENRRLNRHNTTVVRRIVEEINEMKVFK